MSITVYSVEWTYRGRPMRRWFESQRSADWELKELRDKSTKPDAITGPHKHAIEGPSGLVSFLETYGR